MVWRRQSIEITEEHTLAETGPSIRFLAFIRINLVRSKIYELGLFMANYRTDAGGRQNDGAAVFSRNYYFDSARLCFYFNGQKPNKAASMVC
ncbi:hypothetical protein D3C78_1601920 [compost metagenome]